MGNLGDTLTNPGQAILFSCIEDYIETERESFEANKQNLKVQAEEEIFKQLPKEKQERLIAEGYFDKNGKRIKTKYTSEGKDFNTHEEYREWFCSIYGHEAQLHSPHFHHNEQDKYTYETNHRKELEKGYSIYGDWKTICVKNPLLKTLWGQSGDYNDKVNVPCGNDQAPVGYVATAVGQLMAYHKKPAVFKGRVMHWEDMTKIDAGDMFSNIHSKGVWFNSTAKEDIQHLLARLGDSDLLNMNYGCDGSGSNTSKAVNTLNKLGYSALHVNYDSFKIMDEIHNNRPIYIEGCVNKTEYKFLGIRYKTNYNKCHAWLIDGLVRLRQPITTFRVFSCYDDVTTSYETYSYNFLELFHHNFGWGENGRFLDGGAYKNGIRNNTSGWYRVGIFDPNNNIRGSSGNFKSSSETNYKYRNTILIIN